jgi:signal transduction histidine kinase
MEIALYSSDPELHMLCQHVVRLTPGARCMVRADFRMPPSSPSDVCIYDSTLGPIENVPDHQGVPGGIVVVSRAELPQIRCQLLHLRAIILLRPLNRARLEIAIEQSLSQPTYTVDCELMRLNRDEMLECLLGANLRLQEYDQDRSHFLARAIHELWAPLTSLNGYCRLLADEKLGPLRHDQTTVITRMRRSVERLGRIVSSIFELSVGPNCEWRPERQVGNIIECVERAMQEVEPLLRDRRIELSVKFEPPAGVLSFDEQHIEQVFLNLLDNSCKFSSRGGAIRIRGYPYCWERCTSGVNPRADRPGTGSLGTFNSYRIDIADDGPGIPAERLERTFAESNFYAGGNDRSGPGLGLAIARLFVDQNQGQIWAESKDSQGVTFCVLLPHLDDQTGPKSEESHQSEDDEDIAH